MIIITLIIIQVLFQILGPKAYRITVSKEKFLKERLHIQNSPNTYAGQMYSTPVCHHTLTIYIYTCM